MNNLYRKNGPITFSQWCTTTQLGPKGPKQTLIRPSTIGIQKAKETPAQTGITKQWKHGATLSQQKSAGANEPKMTTKHPQIAKKGVTFNLENNTTLECTLEQAVNRKAGKEGEKIKRKKEKPWRYYMPMPMVYKKNQKPTSCSKPHQQPHNNAHWNQKQEAPLY